MTNEKALERTNALRNQSDPDHHDYLDTVISNLKSRIPMRPKIKTGAWDCPACGKYQGSVSEFKRYCRNCGQAIDWSNENV